jgi:hypothetical protein
MRVTFRRAWVPPALGLAAFVTTFVCWGLAVMLSDSDSLLNGAAMIVLLFGPLIAGPAYGLYLIVKRGRWYSALAVIAGPFIAAIVFFETILIPIGNQFGG